MSSPEFTVGTEHVAVLIFTLSITVGVKALTSVFNVWISQRARTRRLHLALRKSKPNQRARIILACSRLEGDAVEPNETDDSPKAQRDAAISKNSTNETDEWH